jgi:hypothetical protein
MYENKKLRTVETFPGTGREDQRRIMEGLSSNMTYCKNCCVTKYLQYNNNKKNVLKIMLTDSHS